MDRRGNSSSVAGIRRVAKKETILGNSSLAIIFSIAIGGLLMASSNTSLRRVNGQRISDHLKALSQFGKNPQGGVSRVAYSVADQRAREYVMELMRAAQLEVRIDAAGNIIGRRAGSSLGLKPLAMGSHVDSVPEGGIYDGNLGVVGAIEVAQTLAENHLTTRHPLEVIVFQNEEGGTYGSHAISNGLTGQQLDRVSQSGKTIRDGIRFIGGDPDRLSDARLIPGDLAGYLEYHIEQGGVLETSKINIGIVEGIVGIRQWDVTVEGFANHAGTTPMDQRHDSLLAAARFIEAVNRIVRSIPGRQVGTVGKIQAFPGAYNVISGRVVLGLELRDLDAAKIQMLFDEIHVESRQIGQATGTQFGFKPVNDIVPEPTNPGFRKIIEESAKQLGLTTHMMPSGAGHDAQEIARICPVGMIFIPSIGGISHSPKEFSSSEDITNGADVLLLSFLRLDEK